jgi:hypothetical protein
VKKEHHELFRQYAPLWDKEELERALLWSGFLRSFLIDGAHSSDGTPECVLSACFDLVRHDQ